MTSERRQGERFEVDFLCNKYVKGRPYLCQASNISPEGLMVHSFSEPDTEEQLIGLQFCLPDSEQVITASGRVVHRPETSDAVGVLFTSIAWEHRQLIVEYLEAQQEEPAGLVC